MVLMLKYVRTKVFIPLLIISVIFIAAISFWEISSSRYFIEEEDNLREVEVVFDAADYVADSHYVSMVACNPYHLFPNTKTEVECDVTLFNYINPPEFVILTKLDKSGNFIYLGELKGRGFYTGKFTFREKNEGNIWLQVFADFEGIGAKSSERKGQLEVRDLPRGFQKSDMSKLVIDPVTGNNMFSNEVIVEFTEQTASARRKEIAASVGGKLTGYYAILGAHQIKINSKGAGGVYKAIENLKNYSEVKDARPSLLGPHIN
jgi:hypothetical protein